MKQKKGTNFFFIVIGLITGSKLLQHFDFQTLSFQKPWIDAIYLITFLVMVVLMIKNLIKKPENKK
ncbi:hypothetical protein KIH23_02665 [Flavobacterium sp. CYK-55]|uniref:hypothetical protein n=1 Tax=Flavobacterium sp. CYK-55 TaxID=2835529 RepID=UPI001BCE6371|nr:hypothetical protein [Flavobacterium sp. CYK-55]MBS7786187.1 hypothetical protein [Flavobacterium sp. CYK-55]